MARVLLMQGIIPPYRIPVFRGLGERHTLRVLHSGTPVGGDHGFEECVVKESRLGPLHLQSDVRRNAAWADAVIAMFDLRWPTMALPLLGRKPFFWWGHGMGASPRLRAVRAALVRRATGLILYDEGPLDAFLAQGIPRERIFVAPNTVEVHRPALPTVSQRRSFLYVGRIQPRKRVDLLLDAFAQVAEELPRGVGVEIVGTGPGLAGLREQARRAGVDDRVHFHGEIRDEARLAEIFARGLAYVSPGHVGLGVLHSFAYGVPVITCQGGDHAPEVANLRPGENGLQLPLTVTDFAAALRTLARDPREAQRLGEAAHLHYVGHRRLDQMVDGFAAALEYGLGKAGATPAARDADG